MVTGGQHVEDGHPGVRGELGDERVGPGPDAHAGDVTGEHVGGVADRLPAADLHLVGAQHHGMAAELGDPRLE
jgi:hypothetical protein